MREMKTSIQRGSCVARARGCRLLQGFQQVPGHLHDCSLFLHDGFRLERGRSGLSSTHTTSEYRRFVALLVELIPTVAIMRHSIPWISRRSGCGNRLTAGLLVKIRYRSRSAISRNGPPWTCINAVSPWMLFAAGYVDGLTWASGLW